MRSLAQRHRERDHFTQEDPIGLAGGMNLYGFAGGDPVNYSDPFGLCPNPLAGGLGGLQCALEDLVGAVKAGPSIFAGGMKALWKNDFATGLAMVPFTLWGAGERVVFQGGKMALREVLRMSNVEGVSGSQGLSLLARLKKGPVDDIAIAAGENGSIRAAFSRRIDDITEVTSRVYDRAGKQTNIWIERFDAAGKKIN